MGKGEYVSPQYVSPQIEIIEVEVEKGFAASSGSDNGIDGWGKGGF